MQKCSCLIIIICIYIYFVHFFVYNMLRPFTIHADSNEDTKIYFNLKDNQNDISLETYLNISWSLKGLCWKCVMLCWVNTSGRWFALQIEVPPLGLVVWHEKRTALQEVWTLYQIMHNFVCCFSKGLTPSKLDTFVVTQRENLHDA